MKPNLTQAIAQKYAGAACTLDGWEAKVMGRNLPVATVAALDMAGPSAQFSWDAVRRVMEKMGGRFET
jgi:hypothetical protein